MSGLIPQAFLDELLQHIEIVDLISSYIALKRQGNSFVACCPFHNEKSPSFNVASKKQFYHCFGCGASGNAISFIMQYLHMEFVEAVTLLAHRCGLSIPRENILTKNNNTPSLQELLEKINAYYQLNLRNTPEAIHYLQNRGINGAIAKRFQLGFAPAGWHTLESHFKPYLKELLSLGMIIQKSEKKYYDRYRQRIMFPIRDRYGKLIGFGGRVIDNTMKPKYLNSPESTIFKKNRELYGLYEAIEKKEALEYIIIVEGYLDVVALAQFDIHNAVAALGTATSSHHIQLLNKYTHCLIFCFDGDSAGLQAAWRAVQHCFPHLETGLDIRFIFLPEGEDPDSLVRREGKTGFLKRLESAMPFNEYFIETLCADCNLHTTAGKTQFIAAATPYLNSMPSGSYKTLLCEELAKITHIESHRIMQLITTAKPEENAPVQKNINRTPTRLAIALLLQYPEILTACKSSIPFDGLEREAQEILNKLIGSIETKAHINTASLLEMCRNSPYFTALNTLAGWDIAATTDTAAKEFNDIMAFLKKQHEETQINYYLSKSRKEGLIVSEQEELQILLKKRHKMIDIQK